jgi:hypothetical protein
MAKAFGILLLPIFLSASLVASALAASVEDFYKGKTIQFVVGGTAGGGYDTYTRLIARHFSQYEQRVRVLQKAFIDTLKDSQLLAEAEKAKLEIDPIDGPGIEKMVNGLYEIEPAIVSRVKQLLESK